MVARLNFTPSWVGIYTESPNNYHSTSSPIRSGGSSGYNTFIGVPSSVRNAINSSKTPAKLFIRLNVTTSGGMALGGHRETSNKARGTLPWYRYLQRYLTPATGWAEYDITSNFMSNYLSGDLHGIVLYGGSSTPYLQAHGLTNNSNSFQFIVEGTWNTAPTPPTVTAPVSSTVADTQVQVRWTAGSDAETPTNQLRYEVQYYNGSSWGNTVTTGQGATSHNYNSTNFPETSNARVRVRTIDSEGLTSSWSTSASFTINHNQPPSTPTNLSPRGGEVFDRTNSMRFTWRHNDDGPQAGYRLRYRVVGASSWVNINWTNSTQERRDFNGGTFALGEYEWQVQTRDQQGLESPWSNLQRFVAGERTNAPIFLEPTSGAVSNSSDLIIRWSSMDQNNYEIELRDGGVSGAVLWSESGNTNRQTQAGYELQNNRSYAVRLRVFSRDSAIWSEWSSVTFSTQFIPPQKPTLTVESTDELGATLTVNWVSDEPATETPTAYVEVFRREYNVTFQQPWILLGSNLATVGSFVDYTPASDQTYEYRVRAWGHNRTFTDSDVVEGEVSFDVSFLQRAFQLSDMIELTNADSRDELLDSSGDALFFAGRRLPVFEVGEHEEHELQVNFRVYTPAELRNALAFLKRPETFLYRDNAGRSFYCVVRRPRVRDLPVTGYDIQIRLYEVDYKQDKEG
ncbi:hypothetical protein BpsS36_00021 [Bacillus phage vB_BpsS-36]|uniref:Fibronectin type-III domain-containing protein n=1 Tax=Bacillus phage vB_BpsS-36 TaxID=2419622 RepID=A0A3G3BX27_9CAUD|nr:hypothetical protein BpsS36_00021 [Bacillus phage vB_BpsS-36]